MCERVCLNFLGQMERAAAPLASAVWLTHVRTVDCLLRLENEYTGSKAPSPAFASCADTIGGVVDLALEQAIPGRANLNLEFAPCDDVEANSSATNHLTLW
mmetsp:Transcript_26170/g.83087  ORF Transcript_26170/g.83087 Transcript_26170/m.83087 type:complete len:101 (+) Transcript_26170:856-1158(+)